MSGVCRERSGFITAAALLLLVFGTVGIVLGLVLLLASLDVLASGGKVVISGQTITIHEADRLAGWSVLYLVTNAIEVVAGYFLWNARKIGGVLAAIGVVASVFLWSLPVPGIPGTTYVVVAGAIMAYSVVVVVLLGLGWDVLK
ncbi:hypothetical protein Pdsh_05710 [Pyrodictium delaneyi]|nr:hypothetical protein Pdsh_05710 [Pyrodictium delaneyi]